jgi:hypothetical protein
MFYDRSATENRDGNQHEAPHLLDQYDRGQIANIAGLTSPQRPRALERETTTRVTLRWCPFQTYFRDRLTQPK